MTDFDSRDSQRPDEGPTPPSQPPSDPAPFQTQLDHVSRSQPPTPGPPSSYPPHAFDLAAMAGALPSGGAARSPYGLPDGQIHSSPTAFRSHPLASYGPPRGAPYPDPAMLARFPPPQVMTGPFLPGPGGAHMLPRQPGFPIPPPMSYGPLDAYGYALASPPPFSPTDPRFSAQPMFAPMPGRMPRDAVQYARRGSDTAPIPTFPRGPPRKPKQSGHALWVGNLPPAAQVTDLKDHFARDATEDIESVFLIAKSNCAFVNYRSEAACVAAMNRFHDSRFHGVRLVCRLRRGSNAAAGGAVPDEAGDDSPVTITPPTRPSDVPTTGEDSPTIARSSSGDAGASSAGADAKTPEKYFIVKSLTAQDLEASVRNGIWATQSHNEDVLNRAFEEADHVYLIFSANKSGEYFGYARMASAISGDPVNLSTLPGRGHASLADPAVTPQSIPTPATTTAPRGRIIDDSARGTIFWEADRADDEPASPDQGASPGGLGSSGQDWGRQFQIEWISTNRLPFYRTRGLRNPWNANREVKIARDGTELEPSVGRRLVSMFQRPSSSLGPAPGTVVGTAS